jgi:hypothetical protein
MTHLSEEIINKRSFVHMIKGAAASKNHLHYMSRTLVSFSKSAEAQ